MISRHFQHKFIDIFLLNLIYYFIIKFTIDQENLPIEGEYVRRLKLPMKTKKTEHNRERKRPIFYFRRKARQKLKLKS